MAGSAGLLAALALRARPLLLLALLPKRAFCSTAVLARSLTYCPSNFSIRAWETFTVLGSRAFSWDNDLIAAFWRRDLLSTLRRWAASSNGNIKSVTPAVRNFATRAVSFLLAPFATSSARRSQKTSSDTACRLRQSNVIRSHHVQDAT